MGNRNWTEEELLLVLDLYFDDSFNFRALKVSDPAIVDLSNTLRAKGKISDNSNLRSPDAVIFKLNRFKYLDDNFEGGNNKGSKKDIQVWEKYKRLKIRDAVAEEQTNFPLKYFGIGIDEFGIEGNSKFDIHKTIERDHRLREMKIQQVFDKTRRLGCSVCDFEFSEMYGNIGNRFAECHHITPLAELNHKTKVGINDLVIVCSNCHSMLHYANPHVKNINELKKHLNYEWVNNNDI